MTYRRSILRVGLQVLPSGPQISILQETGPSGPPDQPHAYKHHVPGLQLPLSPGSCQEHVFHNVIFPVSQALVPAQVV